MNIEGEVVVPIKYDLIGGFREGLAQVGLKGKYGFVDTTGKEVVPLKYDSTGSFREGLAEVSLNGKSGKIDRAGVWQGGPEPTRFGRYIKIVLFLLGMGLIILVLSVMEVIIRGTQ